MMIKKYAFVIGIDTGVHTGVATWNADAKEFAAIKTMLIHQAISYVREMVVAHGDNLLIRVEDARLRTWYQSNTKTRDEERKMLQGVGSVKRDSKIWEDFLTDIGASFEMIHPKSSKTKLNDLSFRRLTKYNGRTSEHARDAAMLVFGR